MSPPAQRCWPVQQLSGYVPLNSGAAPHLSMGSTMTRPVQALRGAAPQLLMHTTLARGPARPPMGPRPAIWPAPQTMGAIQPPRGPNAANTTYVTSLGLAASSASSATVDGRYGQHPGSSTTQEENGNALSSPIVQAPGGHAHQHSVLHHYIQLLQPRKVL